MLQKSPNTQIVWTSRVEGSDTCTPKEIKMLTPTQVSVTLEHRANEDKFSVDLWHDTLILKKERNLWKIETSKVEDFTVTGKLSEKL